MMEASPSQKDFDVAFSLLADDVGAAERIVAELPEEISFFLSDELREEIGGWDGLDVFPAVFRTARVCVILYRRGWGETEYTRLERFILGDRVLSEGKDFLLLVRLDSLAGTPVWLPESEQWIHYHRDGPSAVAATIQNKLEEIEADGSPWRRVTRRTANADPLPVSLYQRHEGGIAEQQFVPTEGQPCDGCTEMVRFRPLIRVQLSGGDLDVQTAEQFCPPCAEERQLVIVVPPDMSEETAHAEWNPTLKQHVDRLLRERVLDILSDNETLSRHGVESVGGAISNRAHFSLILSGPAIPDEVDFGPEVQVSYREIDEADALTDVEFSQFCRARIAEFLDAQGW